MIYIVVRQTLDWGDEAVFRAQLRPAFAPTVELWNDTFTVPYHIFRRELTRIARASWSRVSGAAVVPLDAVPRGGIVLPTDDDDWFAPELGRLLSFQVDGTLAGYSWRSEFLEVPISLRYETNRFRRALFPDRGSNWICTTNNYAVLRTEETVPLVASHVDASRWFRAHAGQVQRFKWSASIMNRSLASQTSLGWVRGRPRSPANLIRKYNRYRRLYRRALPSRLAWCEPYVAMMRDLLDEVRVHPGPSSRSLRPRF